MNRGRCANGVIGGRVGLSVLMPGELENIHAATLEVLARTGGIVEDKEALEIFRGRRCSNRQSNEESQNSTPRRGERNAVGPIPSRSLLKASADERDAGSGKAQLRQFWRRHKRGRCRDRLGSTFYHR